MTEKYRLRIVIFVLILFSSTAFAVVHFSTKEKQEFSYKLMASCIRNAEVPKKTDKTSFCGCVTRNHILFSEYRNENINDATKQLAWVLDYYSGKFITTSEAFKKDPYTLIGPDGDGALISFNSDCLRDNKYHYVIP